MARDVPDSFASVFAEMRKVNEKLCTNLERNRSIIEDLILKANRHEVVRACQFAGVHPQEQEENLEVPSERALLSAGVRELSLCRRELSEAQEDGIEIQLSADDGRYRVTESAVDVLQGQATGSMSMNSRMTGKASEASCKRSGSLESCQSKRSSLSVRFPIEPATSYGTGGSASSDDLSLTGIVLEVDNALSASANMTGASTLDSVTWRWIRLVEQLRPQLAFQFMSKRLRPIFANEVRPGWIRQISRSVSNVNALNTSSDRDSRLFAGSLVTGRSRLQRFIIHPDGNLARLVLILSCFALLYDLITVPYLLCFDITDTGWIRIVDLILTIFWTCDMVVSSSTGYHVQVVVEMRPARVICRYFRSWGILDLMIIASDWTRFVLALHDIDTSTGTILSAGRSFKFYRFLRIVRMFRIFKLFQLLLNHVDSFATEVSLVVGKLVGLVVLIFFINHYIACLWYAIGKYNEVDEITWLTELRENQITKSYAYCVSIHWSLTQFTPATNNVSPVNLRERVFAFFVVMFALIIFSSFLGSLTSAISQLKAIHMERYSEEAKIRRFLYERRVSIICARNIWHCYRTYNMSASSTISFDDVAFFRTLPRKLRISLHQDLSIPTLSKHPAFYYLDKASNDLLLYICDAALREISTPSEHEVFCTGTICDAMLFLNYGSLKYESPLYAKIEDLQAPQFVSEVAVWCSWAHRGTLNTSSACSMISMDIKCFGSMVRLRAEHNVFCALRAYAKAFIDVTNELLYITDVVHTSVAHSFKSIMERKAADAFQTLEGVVNAPRTSGVWSLQFSGSVSAGHGPCACCARVKNILFSYWISWRMAKDLKG